MEIINKKSGGVREMIMIAFPMVVSHACETVMVFTDRMFLSKLGALQMNAAMGGGLSSFVLTAFFLGLISYSTALAAQYLGASKKNYCARVTTQSLIIAAVAYPLILFCKPAAASLMKSSGIDAMQLHYQLIYFNLIIFSSIIVLVRGSLSGFFCGIGRTRIVMLAAIASMVMNIVFNYILIFGKFGFPALGIKGAAIGTILGGLFGVAILFGTYFSKKIVSEFQTVKGFLFDKVVMTKLLRFGYPSGIELFLNLGAFTCMMYLFYSEGAVAATAATIMFNWDMVSFVPLLGVEIGVTSLVGRYMGAERADIAHKATMSGLKIGSMYSAVIFILFVVFPAYLVMAFEPINASGIYKEAAPVAVSMLRIACLYVFVEALMVSLIGALRGAGDTLWAMCLTVGLHVIVVIIEFICLKILGMSIVQSWQILVLSFFAGAVFVYWRYASGKWKNIKVVSAEVGELAKVEGFHDASL